MEISERGGCGDACAKAYDLRGVPLTKNTICGSLYHQHISNSPGKLDVQAIFSPLGELLRRIPENDQKMMII